MKIKILLLFTLFFTSCATFKEPLLNKDSIELTSSNLHLFNGTYKRFSSNNETNSYSTNYYDYNDLFKCFFLKHEKNLRKSSSNEKDFVTLEVIDENKIKVSFIMDGEIEKSKTLKGKINGNAFEFNKRIFLIPLLVLNFYEQRKTRISLSENSKLILDIYTSALANFLIIPWALSTEGSNLEFEKMYEK